MKYIIIHGYWIFRVASEIAFLLNKYFFLQLSLQMTHEYSHNVEMLISGRDGEGVVLIRVRALENFLKKISEGNAY